MKRICFFWGMVWMSVAAAFPAYAAEAATQDGDRLNLLLWIAGGVLLVGAVALVIVNILFKKKK